MGDVEDLKADKMGVWVGMDVKSAYFRVNSRQAKKKKQRDPLVLQKRRPALFKEGCCNGCGPLEGRITNMH